MSIGLFIERVCQMDFFPWVNGLFNLDGWKLIVVTLVMTHITVLSMTIYLHRFSAHRAIELHPVMQHFFRFWLWLTTATDTKEWTAIHRKHHACCETKDDPHSPVIYGINRVLWGGAFLYRKEARNKETLSRYGKGCPDDWVERHVYSPHIGLGIFLLLVMNFIAFGVWGLLVWVVQMVWIPFWAAGVVNGIGHWFGYRNFECSDHARNIMPFGLIMGGEELHNNHHAYPNSARLSSRVWEFDIGWMWIRILIFLRLASVRFSRPFVELAEQKTIDSNTVMAIINNRFYIMAKYSHHVIRPLIHYEKIRATRLQRRILHRAKRLLSREEVLLNAEQKERINKIITNFTDLHVIYEKRLALQAIWKKIKCNNQRIEALKHWCHEAEISGIQVLNDFSQQLKRYTLPSAK